MAQRKKTYLVEMNYDFEWQTAAYMEASSKAEAIRLTKRAAKKKRWALVDSSRWRAKQVKSA